MRCGLLLLLWFTPTGVGTALSFTRRQPRRLVHPHRRGDGMLAGVIDQHATGSPPQAWGRHVLCPHQLHRRRFTPTGVGTAATLPGTGISASVHPHRRGDGTLRFLHQTASIGSPPQAWGRLVHRHRKIAHVRFTPTGVGTAMFAPIPAHPSSVHPHRRGDGASAIVGKRATTGSPPQAWGRLDRENRTLDHPRFTPTGVGTAPFRSSARRCQAVHPHRRGDGFTGVRGYGLTPVHPHRRGDGTQNRCLIPPPSRFTPTGVGTATT